MVPDEPQAGPITTGPARRPGSEVDMRKRTEVVVEVSLVGQERRGGSDTVHTSQARKAEKAAAT